MELFWISWAWRIARKVFWSRADSPGFINFRNLGGSWLLGDVFHECDQVYLFQDCIAFHADGKFSFYSQKEDKIKEAGGLLGINLEPRLNDIFHKEQEKFFKYYEERNEDPQVKNPLEKVV